MKALVRSALLLVIAVCCTESGALRALQVPRAQAASPAEPSPRAPTPGSARLQAQAAELTRWVGAQGGKLGLAVGSALSTRASLEVDADRLLNPASLTKLVTAAVALERLGPSYRYTTALFTDPPLSVEAGGKVGKLMLQGHGDPSLRQADLWRLAHALREQGVTEVGDIYVDQSRFDEQFVPPAFEQQPNEWSAFRAPVSAVALERNTVTLHVLATSPGKPARVWFEPAVVTETRGSIATRKPADGQEIHFSVASQQGGLRAEIGGHVGFGKPLFGLIKRVDDPRLLPGVALKELLRREGIRVLGTIKLGSFEIGRVPSHAHGGSAKSSGTTAREPFASIQSPPLSVLVAELGKNSDNFYAEMLFKTLALEAHAEPASASRAAALARAWLERLGAFPRDGKLVNGSGLFDANRLTARSVLRVLQAAHANASIRHEYLSHLAIGGVDGTLTSRFRARAQTRRIRAKTGTLKSVDALAGYVLADAAGPPLAFAIVVNGIPEKHAEVRSRIDQFVEALTNSASWQP